MRKILIIVVIIISLTLIYYGVKDDKKNYLSIGDNLSSGIEKNYKYFNIIENKLKNQKLNYIDLSNEKYRCIDLLNDIKTNKKFDFNNKTIQNMLIKSDLIILSVGMNDIFSNLNINNDYSKKDLYSKFDDYLNDLEKLFQIIRIYSKEQIIFIGIYSSSDELNEYMNLKLINLTQKYNIDYVDIDNLFKDNDIQKNKTELISMEIINKITEKSKKS